jgi:acyl-coenzyme A synthetase/AMP-(fatty) acid ligase
LLGPSAQVLREHVHQTPLGILGHSAVSGEIEVRDDLPDSESGKIMKQALR